MASGVGSSFPPSGVGSSPPPSLPNGEALHLTSGALPHGLPPSTSHSRPNLAFSASVLKAPVNNAAAERQLVINKIPKGLPPSDAQASQPPPAVKQLRLPPGGVGQSGIPPTLDTRQRDRVTSLQQPPTQLSQRLPGEASKPVIASLGSLPVEHLISDCPFPGASLEPSVAAEAGSDFMEDVGSYSGSEYEEDLIDSFDADRGSEMSELEEEAWADGSYFDPDWEEPLRESPFAPLLSPGNQESGSPTERDACGTYPKYSITSEMPGGKKKLDPSDPVWEQAQEDAAHARIGGVNAAWPEPLFKCVTREMQSAGFSAPDSRTQSETCSLTKSHKGNGMEKLASSDESRHSDGASRTSGKPPNGPVLSLISRAARVIVPDRSPRTPNESGKTLDDALSCESPLPPPGLLFSAAVRASGQVARPPKVQLRAPTRSRVCSEPSHRSSTGSSGLRSSASSMQADGFRSCREEVEARSDRGPVSAMVHTEVESRRAGYGGVVNCSGDEKSPRSACSGSQCESQGSVNSYPKTKRTRKPLPSGTPPSTMGNSDANQTKEIHEALFNLRLHSGLK